MIEVFVSVSIPIKNIDTNYGTIYYKKTDNNIWKREGGGLGKKRNTLKRAGGQLNN